MNMRLITAASGFLAACLFSALGGPSLSSAVFAPESRITDIVGRSCEVEPGTGRHRAADEQTKRCPGLGGARVVVTSDNASVALGFEWSSKERADEVLRDWSLGYKLEWRGYRSTRGFEPYATIIRVFATQQAGPLDRPVLAVIRVRRGEACVMGLVDIAANADPYEAARSLADTRAPGFACGRDTPRVEGVATAQTSGLLARL